jgi:hypothetical protein
MWGISKGSKVYHDWVNINDPDIPNGYRRRCGGNHSVLHANCIDFDPPTSEEVKCNSCRILVGNRTKPVEDY